MTPAEERDRTLVAGLPLVFGRRIALAHEALLRFAGECEPDRWPSVKSTIRFAAAHEVDAQVLAALVGIVSYRLSPKGKLIFADAQRAPELVRRTSPGRLPGKVLAAYGLYVAAATQAERARAHLH
jgi:hypothetical protein